MSELAQIARMSKFPTCVQRINYPIHKGQPNPAHGKYVLVGSIPADCYDFESRSSKRYDTEQEAIDAAISAGAERIQRCDNSFVEIPTLKNNGGK